MRFKRTSSKPAPTGATPAPRAPRIVPGRPPRPGVAPRRWSLLLPQGFERK